MTEERKFFKTVFIVTVLSEDEPISPHADIRDVLDRMDDGPIIGDVTYDGALPISPDKIEEELRDVGNDGSFFSTDDED